jgi:hypothetical protein
MEANLVPDQTRSRSAAGPWHDPTVRDDELLDQFHRQIRLAGKEDEPAPGIVQDRDGFVARRYPLEPGTSYSMIECPEGLGDDPDAEIRRQVEFFAERGDEVEWKTYSYDQPADLCDRLKKAGFRAEDPETLLIGELASLVHEVSLPAGVRIREVDAEQDFGRIDTLMDAIWGRPGHGLAAEKKANPDLLDAFVVEESAAGPVLCAAWLRYTPGTEFASMWGGSTLPQWRRKGLYRATVSLRAQKALDRGYRFVRLDTSPDSRPILVNLGLRAVATTTPYVLTAS